MTKLACFYGACASILLLCATVSVPRLQAAENKEIKPGFRDLRWGDPIPQGMEPTAEEDWYKRPDDDLAIGGVPLVSIAYNFYKGRLQCVLIRLPNGTSSDILTVLEQQWGRGFQDNRYMRDRSWRSKDPALGWTWARFDENSVTGSATIFIQSERIAAEEKADKKAAGAQAGRDM